MSNLSGTWLIGLAQPFPVTYKLAQQGMKTIRGAVLHTTNHTGGAETFERFQVDWNSAQSQSAHFMVDRAGNIGQFRALEDVAWHILAQSVNFIGIEHILRAQAGEDLTSPQIAASQNLLAALSERLHFPLVRIVGEAQSGQIREGTKELGVGVHQQFMGTFCGRGVFWETAMHRFGARVWDILPPQQPTGKWKVKVGDYHWIYIFDDSTTDSGTARWQKLVITNPKTDKGHGTWTNNGNKFSISWETGSIEEWEIPLQDNTSGILKRQGFNDVSLTTPERVITAQRSPR